MTNSRLQRFNEACRQLGRLCRYTGTRFLQDGFTYRAAALTFTSLLSLVPLLLVTFSVLSAFPVFNKVGEGLEQFIFANFIPAAGEVVQQYLHSFVHQAAQLSAVGIFILIVTAVLMLFTMEQAFNAIWRVQTKRKGVSSFLLYWAILTLSPILVGTSLVISSYIFSLPFITDAAAFFHHEYLLAILPSVLIFSALTLLYVVVPNCPVKIRYGLVGAFIATLLFEFAKFGFASYLASFPVYRLIYGTLAAIPIFLIWIYLSWLIVLFGALVTYTLTYHHSIRSNIKLDSFTHALLWLKHFAEAKQKNKLLTLAELVRLDSMDYEIKAELQIKCLIDTKLIYPTLNGYMLYQDLSHFTLFEFYQLLPWKLPSSEQLKKYTALNELKLESITVEIEKGLQNTLKNTLTELF